MTAPSNIPTVKNILQKIQKSKTTPCSKRTRVATPNFRPIHTPGPFPTQTKLPLQPFLTPCSLSGNLMSEILIKKEFGSDR
jgi:hypothetical protein